MSRTKPLLVVFGGQSTAGTRAGASHTAAAATSPRALQALFRAAGVVAVRDVQELVDTAALLTEQPPPRGPRLAVLSNAGGLGVLSADAAQRHDVPLPTLSEALRSRLRSGGPDGATFDNPVDLGAGAGAADFARVAETLAGSGEVDALLIATAATAVTDVTGTLAAIDQVTLTAPDLPWMSVVVGTTDDLSRRSTKFRSVDDAVVAYAHACRWVRWNRTGAQRVRLRAQALEAEDRLAANVLPGADAWLDMSSAEGILRPTGIAVARYVVAGTEDEVVAALHRLRTPVAVKTADPAAVHKTEAGLVRTGITSAAEAVAATRDLRRAVGDERLPVLVQEQVVGVELAYGMVRDPTFGPLVMVASGGTEIALWDDQTFLMPPLDPQEVRSALTGLRSWPLLNGFRGSAPLDVDAVVDQVVSLGRLALEHPEVVELDLNPILVTTSGPVCVDAKVRVRV